MPSGLGRVIVPLTFTEVGVDGYHDIEIDWRDAHDPDSMVGGVLAHSDFPQGCRGCDK